LKKETIGPSSVDFVFAPGAKVVYQPGQYMEWTLPHAKPDDRGSRRYFTLASSPTEENLRIGVKLYSNSSTYKKALLKLNPGTPIAAGQLGGDFVLPKDPSEKLVFIAGGIGITPFRSMIKYLLDTQEVRDVVLLYAANTGDDLAYRDIFTEAERQLGIKVTYVLSKTSVQAQNIRHGLISPDVIKAKVPNLYNSTYYISGPHSMVDAVVAILKAMGVHRSRIKVDFFSGYA
jgi:ferredoxin-NADP reductase